MTTETKQCQNCKQNFVIEPEDFKFYEKMQVPPPTFCPMCRMIRRFMFRNEHFLFRRKNDVDSKEIFSGIPAAAPYKVYDHDYWWSDNWDPMQYGKEYNFNQPFFTQFRELLKAVPWCAKAVLNVINSEYSEQASYLKNVYLSFDVDHVEDSAYLVNSGYAKDSYDLLNSFNCELCYETTAVTKSYKIFYSYNCRDCNDVWFSKNCVGCSDCFGCMNLKGKKYHIFNKPYTKEEYAKKIESLNLGSVASLKTQAEEVYSFWKKFPVKYMNGFRNITSSGDYLNNTKNTKESFLVSDIEKSKFLQLVVYKCTDSYDYTVWGDTASRMYECLTCGAQVDSLKFCFNCWPSSRDLEYCVSCHSSSNLFACVGLRNKQHCIFNKQYSKEEYFVLRDKIISHMKAMPYIDSYKNSYSYGEFFPPEFSHLPYNQSLANDFFPLSKEEAERRGHNWIDPERREYKITLKTEDIPDHIKDVSESIMEEVIQCEICKRAYRVISQEFTFLKKFGIPIPRRCVECRLRKRFSELNQPRFYNRSCQCAGGKSDNGVYSNVAGHKHGAGHCPNEFETSYSPERPDIVYCEDCYLQEVV